MDVWLHLPLFDTLHTQPDMPPEYASMFGMYAIVVDIGTCRILVSFIFEEHTGEPQNSTWKLLKTME